MSKSSLIYEEASNLINKYGSRDPEEIISNLNIDLFFVDYFKDLMGMYTYKWNHRAIFINNSLDNYMKKIVLCHELGHDILHRNVTQDNLLKEFIIFNTKNKLEYEANSFAAHILLDFDDIKDLISQEFSIYRIAQELETDVNLLIIKLEEMKKLGYDIDIPIQRNDKFLIKK